MGGTGGSNWKTTTVKCAMAQVPVEYVCIVTLLGYMCNQPRGQGNWVTYAPTRGQILKH